MRRSRLTPAFAEQTPAGQPPGRLGVPHRVSTPTVGGVPVRRSTPHTRRPRHGGRSRRRRGLRLGGSATRRSFLTRNDAQRAVHRRDDRRPAVIPAHLIAGRRPADDGLDGAGSPRGVHALWLRLDAISYGCVHLSRPSSCPDKRERPPVEYRGSPKADWRARRAPSGPSKSRSGRAKRARSGRLHRLRGSYHTSRSAERPSYGVARRTAGVWRLLGGRSWVRTLRLTRAYRRAG